VEVSNGLGYVSPFPGLGLPAGSFVYHRLGAYVGASSKWKRNLTLSYGVRYARETGRSDNQFGAIPQLNALIPGLGNSVRTHIDLCHRPEWSDHRVSFDRNRRKSKRYGTDLYTDSAWHVADTLQQRLLPYTLWITSGPAR